jgi:hypothetical protein
MVLMIILALYCFLGALTGVSWFGMGREKYLFIPLSTAISAVMLHKIIFSGEKFYVIGITIFFYLACLVLAARLAKD